MGAEFSRNVCRKARSTKGVSGGVGSLTGASGGSSAPTAEAGLLERGKTTGVIGTSSGTLDATICDAVGKDVEVGDTTRDCVEAFP